jgi:hypothetical protein
MLSIGTRQALLGVLTSIAAICSASMAQTTLVGGGTSLVGSATVLNPTNTFTHIYVVFPPQTGTNNSNFVTRVMTQSAIDGVTVAVPWNAVELDTSPPSTTPCASVGSDTCQLDPMTSPPYYHSYDWTVVNGTGCGDTTTNSTSQWFCDFPSGSGTYKRVNIQLFGMSAGPINGDTPSYVTSSTWLSATGVSSQDAVNTINASGCGGYSGNQPPGFSTWAGDNGFPNSTIYVTGWTNHGFTDGDTIWVSGFSDPKFNYTGRYGATVHWDSSSKFHYTATGQTLNSQSGGPGTAAVTALQSWLVPYEAPYAAGWLSFLRAAIYHYNHLNITSSGYGKETLGQIAYIRPGVARGGEAIPICTSSSPMTGFSKDLWVDQAGPPVGWYTQVVSAVQAANPQMQIMYSINAGDPASKDPDYATREAKVAVANSNAIGMFDGFGSQGLAQADTNFNASNCPDTSVNLDTGNDWGCMFAKYWSGASGTIGSMTASPTTVPLELQQIDCSNPTGYTAGSGTCFQGGIPGKTGDLRTLFPFVTGSSTQASQHASIIELYSQDALLAYDPKFCDPDNINHVCKQTSLFDWFGTTLGADSQYNFYENVGQGVTCTGACYSTAIDTAHGYH